MGNRSIDFIVDGVDALIAIEDTRIAPPPQMFGSGESYLTGIGKLEGKVVLLMDTRRIVGGEELSTLTGVLSKS